MNPNQRLLRSFSTIIILLSAALLVAPTPAGAVEYKITKISNNNYNNFILDINNIGQITWGSVIYDNMHGIYIYDNGNINPIPNGDNWFVDFLSINDNGEMVWVTERGISLYSNGTAEIIAPAGAYPRINNKGHVVYIKMSEGIGVYLYDNGTISPIYVNSDYSNILSPDINDRGQIVWSGYEGYEFQIYLYNNGTPTKLTNYSSITGNTQSNACPRINNNGQIVWTGHDSNSGYNIYL
jgi:hypothetical protein